MPVAVRTSMLALVLLALSACTTTPAGSARAAITGGTIETGYPAVFALAYDGLGGCTGTCIGPRIGITAKHCVEGDPAEAFTALFGDSEESPELILQVTALELAPDADLALVAFDADCPAVIPHNQTPLEDHLGEPVVMVGFGVTTEAAEDAGLKRSGTATLSSVDPAEVRGLEPGELATSNVPAGTCNGDSGGPTFMTFGGAQSMVGVTSRGSLRTASEEWPCGEGHSIAVRADSHTELIESFIAAHSPGVDPPPEMGAPDAGSAGPDPGTVDHSGGCSVGSDAGAGGLTLVLILATTLLWRRRRRS